MKKTFFLLFFLTVIQQGSFAQNASIDSLLKVLKTAKDDTNMVNILNTIGKGFWQKGKLDSAYILAKNAKHFSEKLNFKKGLANSLEIIGIVFYLKGDYPMSLENHLASIIIKKEIGDKKGISNSYNNIGAVYFNQGNYPEALKCHFSALKIREAIGDKEGVAASYNNIGLIYNNQNNYSEALKSHLLSLKIKEEIGDKKGIAYSYTNIGLINDNQKDYDEALKNHIEALKMYESFGEKRGIASCYNNIGSVYFKQENYREALKNFLSSLKKKEEMGDKHGMASSYINIGNVYTRQKKYKEAEISLSKGRDLAAEVGHIEYLKNSYKGLVELDSIIGLCNADSGNWNLASNYFNGALQNYKMYVVYKDSLINEASIKKSEREKNQYESDKKELALQKEMQLNALKFEYEKKQAIAKTEQEKKQLRLEEELKRKQIEYEYTQRQAKIEAENTRKQSLAKTEQEKKDAIANAEIHRQKLIRNATAGSLALVLLLASTIFYSLQQNKKKNKIITQQKQLVDIKNIEVEQQNKELAEKNNEILQSITYARRIQEAILPSDRLVKEFLNQSFILYKPKDIVSGDFYWMEPIDDTIYFAAVDCTGHGVPGAFVSIVGHNGLNRALLEFKLRSPAAILDKLNELVAETFNRQNSETIKDGMDIALCAYNFNTHILEFAGANNPLWLFSNETFTEFKADKQPIGAFDNRKPFTNNTIQLKHCDTFYIFSDGYADQFGGPDNKKFSKKRMRELFLGLQHLPPAEQRAEIDGTIETWLGQYEQIDDICVIGVKV